VGAGISGLTAARELFRSGYTNIDIYEASGRVAGRNYSVPASPEGFTALEMGAMRIPFFSEPGSGGSVLDYYRGLFGIGTEPFPDPGSDAVGETGIYVNGGYGPDPAHPYPEPRLDLWKSKHAPPNEKYEAVYEKWSRFADMFVTTCQPIYNQGPAVWEPFWRKVVSHYWTLNFRELAFLPALTPAIPPETLAETGYFGGLGMTTEEAELFYVIGAGDGGWGAFYDISCLYVIRTLLCGYGNNHQLIQGTFTNGAFTPGPQYGTPTFDSLGTPLVPPGYLGVQSFSECLLYQPVSSGCVPNLSLYQAMQEGSGFDVNLYTSSGVRSITRLPSGQVQLGTVNNLGGVYDAVILTPPTWAMQMSIDFSGFSQEQLPWKVQSSMKVSHWISSCKVFFRLKRRYWGNGSKIPQVISTDTFLQDVYGYAASVDPADPGVLLVSYTWEDDANKLLATDEQALAAKCLRELDRLLMQCTNIQQPISPFVDQSSPVVFQWSKQPTYRGCAKLYRQRSWDLDYALLSYNQDHSAASGLYFAGEAYSVEGGWTEPAVRLGLDAVLHVVQNTGGRFLNGFSMADYPTYSRWSPSKAAAAPEHHHAPRRVAAAR